MTPASPHGATFDRVKAILVDLHGHKAEAATPETTIEDVGGDSLDAVELEMACEDAFGFRLTMGDADGFGSNPTLAHVVEVVDRMTLGNVAA